MEFKQSSRVLFSLWTFSLLFPPIFLSLKPVMVHAWASPSPSSPSVLHRSASWLLMMLMLMSPPPPSIPGTAAPPFSLLSDWLTDRLTPGPLERSRTHPRCLSIWLPLAPPSACLPLSSVIDAPLRSALQPAQRCCCCCCWSWGRFPLSLCLSLSLSLSPGGFSMYGCAKERDAVGWRKTKKTYTGCWGDSRRRDRRIRALFWMGRGFTLCGRRVWVAEVRNGSSEMFFPAQHRL